MWNELDDGRFTYKGRTVGSKEQCIIVSQDCDIVASLNQEPYIEALICKVEKPQFASAIDRNSARYFLVDPSIGLVANARYRAHIAKAALATLAPRPWSSGTTRFDRFVRWLGRRYDRPALPTSLVESFQNPINRIMADFADDTPHLSTAFSRVVREIRVSQPSTDHPPFEVQMILLLEDDLLSEEEDQAIETAMSAIRNGLDPAQVHLDPIIRRATEDDLSIREYFATRPLFLEYLTYRGDEVDGAEPTGRV